MIIQITKYVQLYWVIFIDLIMMFQIIEQLNMFCFSPSLGLLAGLWEFPSVAMETGCTDGQCWKAVEGHLRENLGVGVSPQEGRQHIGHVGVTWLDQWIPLVDFECLGYIRSRVFYLHTTIIYDIHYGLFIIVNIFWGIQTVGWGSEASIYF